MQIELKLAREAKGNKKVLCKYTSSGKKTNENEGLLLSGAGNVVTRDVEKAQVFHMGFFPQFSLVRSALCPPRSLSLIAVCRYEAVPTVGEDRMGTT